MTGVCCRPLPFLLQLHSSSDRGSGLGGGAGGGGGYRPGVSGCGGGGGGGPLRATTTTTTSVVQRRKQSEQLFGLLLELSRVSPAENQLLLRAGTIPR